MIRWAAVLTLVGCSSAHPVDRPRHDEAVREFQSKIAWQQSREPEPYRLFRQRFATLFNSKDRPGLLSIMSDTFNDKERTLGFLVSLREENGPIEVLRFKFFDNKKQRNNGEPLAVIHAEFENGPWSDVRLGLDSENLMTRFIITDPNYNDELPSYANKTPLQLPFVAGERWVILWGGDTEELNYHVTARSQRNALDFCHYTHAKQAVLQD